MTIKSLLLGGAFALTATTAFAGPCTDRITQLEKALNQSDAGSGPTQPSAAGAAKQDKSKEHAATQGMNAVTGQKAASPADVRSQTQGGPTAAQAAENGGVTPGKPQDISYMLRMARDADARGDANACQKAVDDAQKAIRG